MVGWLGYLTELGGCSQSEDASWRNRQVLGWVGCSKCLGGGGGPGSGGGRGGRMCGQARQVLAVGGVGG